MKKDEYDVIIIGAGMSGLISGCYLAKSGMKVLIIDKNKKPGGYCTSFKKGQFLFDACAHSLGGFRHDGNVSKIFGELGLSNRVNIKRYSPFDAILTPEYSISFYADLDKTIGELQDKFPKESKKIKSFFYDLKQSKDSFLFSFRNETFSSVLNRYFKDFKLKATLAFLLLGNAGLPDSLISGYSGSILFREFIIDGGYYPEGGMQFLSDNLTRIFNEFGGRILLSHHVKGIRIRDDMATSVELEIGDCISSKFIISACDVMQFFHNLNKKEQARNNFIKKMLKMKTSLSMFILYLGLTDNALIDFSACSNIWVLPFYDIERLYLGAMNRRQNNLAEYMVRVSPDKKTLVAFLNADFKNETEWNIIKNELANNLIDKIAKIIPSLKENIDYKGTATPFELYKWTLNYRGAAYGWSAIPQQLMMPGFLKFSFIKNLFLAGHWSTFGHGLNGAIFSGYTCAKMVLKKNC